MFELAGWPIGGGMIVFVASSTVRATPASAQIGQFSMAAQELSGAAA